MDLPKRKSQTLINAILELNKNLTDLKSKYQSASNQIVLAVTELLRGEGNKIQIVKRIEDLQYEMDSDILLNLEIEFENLAGLELDLVNVEPYLPLLKDEQELLKDLILSTKNYLKVTELGDESLSKNEKDNLEFLDGSYQKLTTKMLDKLDEIFQLLTEQIQKIRKMENI